MALTHGLVQLYLDLWQRGVFKSVKSVIELGSQEFYQVRPQDFERWLAGVGLSGYTPERFPNLNQDPDDWRRRCPAKPFYELLGAERYACIDVNAKHGAIPLDLNAPLSDETLSACGQFDLVTDHGCAEHVFNIDEVFRTMHRLCAPHGFIVSAQNLYGGNGYYNFDTAFYEGLAAANQYRVLFASYLITPKYRQPGGVYDQFHVAPTEAMLRTLDWATLEFIGLCYVFQKPHDRPFQLPYQDGLLARRQGHYGFRVHGLTDPLSRIYVPVTDDSLAYMSTRALVNLVLRRIAARVGRSR